MSEDRQDEGARSRKDECERIINTASAASAAAGGLTLVPGSDAILIMPVQIWMVVALGRVFGVRVSKSAAKAAIYASLGRVIGLGGVSVLSRLVPGFGNVVNAGVAFSVTQGIGNIVVDQLVEGDFAY